MSLPAKHTINNKQYSILGLSQSSDAVVFIIVPTNINTKVFEDEDSQKQGMKQPSAKMKRHIKFLNLLNSSI